MALAGVVVDRMIASGGRNTDAVVQIVAGQVVVEPAQGAPVLGARLNPLVAAAVDPHVAAGIKSPALGLHVDDARGTEPKFVGKRAGDEFDP